MCIVMVLAMEAELGALFTNSEKVVSIQNKLI